MPIQCRQSINSFNLTNMTFRGKFYENDNKDNEISADEINKIAIPSESTTDISTCGRSVAASETEGTLNLHENETKICTLY